MYEIIIGRSEEDREKYELKGSVLVGKHYIKMGQTTSLSSNIYLDVNRSHVVFICGKRGSGKSYTMGVITEGISNLPKEVAENLSVVIFDTMGIYWTMKYPNYKDKELLKKWGFEGKGLDIEIFTPTGHYKDYKNKGIPTDLPFSIKPSELSAPDWCMTFELDINSEPGVLIEKTINELKKSKKDFTLDQIIEFVKKDPSADKKTKDVVINQFSKTKNWGLFSDKGTAIKDLVGPNKVSVIDLSCYATIPGAWGIKSLVIGIISQKLFIERMLARKTEEYASIHKATHYFEEKEKGLKQPLVWLVLDEAHEFLPNKGKTTATDALVTILREGREPGVSLVLASQQPGKIHTDVMTQSDVVIAHRLTAKIDVQALGTLMQSYMRKGLDAQLNTLPRVKGAAIVFDDLNERIYPMQIRPRFTWHGGAAPHALKEVKEEEEFKL